MQHHHVMSKLNARNPERDGMSTDNGCVGRVGEFLFVRSDLKLMRPFQLSLRFIVPLAIVIGISALVLLPLVDDLTQRWFLRDLDTRAQMVVASVREPAIELL